jgi:hypothetical protein
VGRTCHFMPEKVSLPLESLTYLDNALAAAARRVGREACSRLLVEHLALCQRGEVFVVAVVADDARGGNSQHRAVGKVGSGRGAAV